MDFVAAEGTDDICEDDFIIRPRNAVLGAGGHHETGKPTQIAQLGGRQFGSGIVDCAHRTVPMVRPRMM